MKPTFLFLFLMIGSMLFAQDNCEQFQKEAISFVRPYMYFKGGQSYPSGLFYGKLKKELEISPMGLAEFKKYKRNRNIGYLMIGASIGALLSTGLTDNRKTQGALLIGSIGFSIGSISFSLDSQRNLHRSVWLRNDDILHGRTRMK